MPPNVNVKYVARDRLLATLPRLRATIKAASFVAFDTELSGLSAHIQPPSLMDTVEQRYMQFRESARSFAIVQFGLSCFTWCAEARAFNVQTFQFPIYARHDASIKGFPDRSFLAQAKCLSYIRDHGFDLNAWVDDGIGYLSHREQQQLEDVLSKPLRDDVKRKFQGDSATAIRTHENERFLKGMRVHIQKMKPWEKDAGDERCSDSDWFYRFVSEHVSTSDHSVMLTEPLAPFRRSALMALAEKEFPCVAVVDCPVDNDSDAEVQASPWKRCLRIVATSSEDERHAIETAQSRVINEEHERRNLSLTGFTAVMDELFRVENQTPVVGHNMLLDMMQCYDKFRGPLPSTCAEFLFELNKWLGGVRLFDTKVLVEYAMDHVDLFSDKLEHSALEHVYSRVSAEPFHGPQLQHSRAINSETGKLQPPLGAHQAGYDAYMTGVVFSRVCTGLGVPNEAMATIGELKSDSSQRLHHWHEALLQQQNSIAVHHILPPMRLSIPGPYPNMVETSKRDTFLGVELTRAWLPKLKPFHIQRCIAWAIGLHNNKHVRVRYETKTRVFVELPTPQQAAELLAVHQDCKPAQGSDQDPLPSLGCVDLFRCSEAEGSIGEHDSSTERPMEVKRLKRDHEAT